MKTEMKKVLTEDLEVGQEYLFKRDVGNDFIFMYLGQRTFDFYWILKGLHNGKMCDWEFHGMWATLFSLDEK
jgi:hypothetical protein